MSDEEKTEDPTPDKRRKAEEEGNFAKSKDAGSVAASAAVILLLSSAGPAAFVDFQTYVKHCFSAVGRMDDGVLGQVSQLTMGIVTLVTVPLAGAAALGGVAMSIAEVGLRLNWSLCSCPRQTGQFVRLNERFETLVARAS